MEDKKTNGLTIRKLGNSIQFTTPEGVTYYKNWTNFVQSIGQGRKIFNAPLSKNNNGNNS